MCFDNNRFAMYFVNNFNHTAKKGQTKNLKEQNEPYLNPQVLLPFNEYLCVLSVTQSIFCQLQKKVSMSMKGYITQVLKILLWLWYLPSPPIQKSLGKAFWLNCVYLEERGSIPGNQSHNVFWYWPIGCWLTNNWIIPEMCMLQFRSKWNRLILQ